MNPDSTTELGRRGEALACRHLEAQGLQLLERNYRCRAGEIDLVMLDGSTLVLVEVRLRSTSEHGGAAATVGFRKQQRFMRAARHLLLTRPDYRRLQARFDVVAIDPGPVGAAEPVVTWIRDAFRIRG
ncbi:MAG: YraN family protein [Steroidobacteraceae bacterium]|nr:YraN family protein [Steroidobacteraceae bacterium]